jgi:hypothetical protein
MKTVLKSNTDSPRFSGEETMIIAERDWFEKVRLSSCYGDYDQKNDPANCGDWAELLTEEFAVRVNAFVLEETDEAGTWEKGDNVFAWNDSYIFDFIIENGTEGEDYEWGGEEVEAYTYRAGSNHKSTYLSAETFEPDWLEVEEEEAAVILQEYEAAQLHSEATGSKAYKGETFWFVVSYWDGAWETATVSPIEDEQQTEE